MIVWGEYLQIKERQFSKKPQKCLQNVDAVIKSQVSINESDHSCHKLHKHSKNIEQKSEYLNQSRREGLSIGGVDASCQSLSSCSKGENAWRDAGQVDQEVPAAAVWRLKQGRLRHHRGASRQRRPRVHPFLRINWEVRTCKMILNARKEGLLFVGIVLTTWVRDWAYNNPTFSASNMSVEDLIRRSDGLI